MWQSCKLTGDLSSDLIASSSECKKYFSLTHLPCLMIFRISCHPEQKVFFLILYSHLILSFMVSLHTAYKTRKKRTPALRYPCTYPHDLFEYLLNKTICTTHIMTFESLNIFISHGKRTDNTSGATVKIILCVAYDIININIYDISHISQFWFSCTHCYLLLCISV